MLRLGKLLPHQRPLFSWEYHVIFTQTVFEGIPVFAVKQTNLVRLLAQVLQDRVVFLNEDPDRLLCMAAQESKHDNMSFFFVNAVEAEQSSMIYNVGSPINTW